MRGGEKNRLHLVALAVLLIVGTVGFFNGVLRDVEPQGYLNTRPESEGDDESVRLVPTQAELAAGPHGPNRERFAENFASLAAARRGLSDDIGRPTEAEWDEAMAARAKLRAFNGAPPVVPHAIDQRGFPSCVTCHLDGLVIENRTAPAMSHEPMANCTQCHVTDDRPAPGPELPGGPTGPNGFQGVDRGGRGERAGLGAPPTIPHSTHMRERCESCHGVLATGLRTSHACQQNCQQCHGPAASLDQHPRTPPPFAPER